MTTDVGIPTAGPEPQAPDRTTAIAGAAVSVAAACAIFAPILYYMAIHWKTADEYSHGFIVGPLAIYFGWERRAKLSRAKIEPSWWGVLPLALGATSLAIGRLGVELMAMRASFVMTVIGLVLLLLGKEVFRILAFPLCFLFLMVPLPGSLVNVIAFPLQLIAADVAVQALYWLHIPALREGNIIHLANTELFVAEACSGLRSLMALGTLAVVFAYFFRRNNWERIVIVLSAIPIAILVNAFRVAITGILTYRMGPGAAYGVIHQTEGLFTFGLAFMLLLLEAWLLSMLARKYWRKGAQREAT